MRDILTGKKTYIAAVLTILGALLAYFTGEATLDTTAQLVVTAILGATIRAGSKADAEAVVDNHKPK